MKEPDFWNDRERARQTVQRVKHLKSLTVPLEELLLEVEDLEVLDQLAHEQDDEQTREEVTEKAEKLGRSVERFELHSMLSHPQDPNNAFLSIHSGAGGTESCDWAEMLLRMYTRWAEREGYKTELVDLLAGEEAGIKSATIHVIGQWAFGYLKSEIGVHRLVRISPFDSGKRRHTSFAAVDIVPEVDEEIAVDIKDSEIEMDFLKSSGPGGQNVNKVSSAVRLKHIPTGLTVLCQSERSQHKNRKIAMNLLKAKLNQLESRKRQEEMASLYDEKGEIAWGSQIRSYVLQPYRMVKDTRTGYQTGDTDAALDGEITAFMDSYLRQKLKTGSAAGSKA